MIGSVIDKYEVLQRLGEGATATVYRGRHLAIGRDVAIKVLHPHLSASTRYRERFNREAKAVGRLSHQNIVSILDYSGSNAEECYIVTELVDGVTLLELLEEHGRLPSEIATLIGMDLASALSFAHVAGVIHRDIKPANVMLRRDGTIKLMDFGVARVLDEGSITLDGSLIGSPAYMSPQQALDDKLDGRTDLFSLGSLLFHAVTGHPPFPGSNPSVILRNIIEGNRPDVLELAPATSPRLAAVIDRLMRPLPDDRPHNAEEARKLFAECLAESELTPDHPATNLRSFLVEPAACAAALDTHLKSMLLRRGRERLRGGDHLGALQLFNRLLAIDEDNQEVVALIQALHQPAEPARRRRALPLLAAAVALLVGIAAWYFLATPSQVAAPPVPAPVAAALVEAPVPPPAAALTPGTPGDPMTVPEAPPRPTMALATSPVLKPKLGSPAPPAVAPASADARVVVKLSTATWAEIWLDGARVGYTRKGPASNWAATAQRPLQVSPGTHTLMVRNDHAEPWEERFTVAADQDVEFSVQLRRRPVTFTINPLMPRSCSVTVGSTSYGTVSGFGASFELDDPDKGTPVIFDCPAPLGEIRASIGATDGGETVIIPTSVPVSP